MKILNLEIILRNLILKKITFDFGKTIFWLKSYNNQKESMYTKFKLRINIKPNDLLLYICIFI